MKRIITIASATGNVLAVWLGGDEQSLPAPPPGQLHLDRSADPDGTSYMGRRWNGAAFVSAPPRLSRNEFMNLFTPQEWGQAKAARKDSPNADYWWDQYDTAIDVDMADPRVSSGLDVFVALGVLTPERKAQILSWVPN